MVDVGSKQETLRSAYATGSIRMNVEAFDAIISGTSKKGDVLGIARIAAIQGAKRCSDLIPLCHPVPLTNVSVEFSANKETSTVRIDVTCQTLGRTGVEMEALSGVSTGLLTIYDMLKAVDKRMDINGVRLLRKSGGKSGTWLANF